MSAQQSSSGGASTGEKLFNINEPILQSFLIYEPGKKSPVEDISDFVARQRHSAASPLISFRLAELWISS
jgi:hypothetical protein